MRGLTRAATLARVAPFAALLAVPAAAQDAPPSLVGTWSGASYGPAGQVEQADQFRADGTFTSVGRLPGRGSWLPPGMLVRIQGTWRATPAGPDRFRVELSVQDWGPRQVCNDGAYPQPKCEPFDLPVKADTVLVTLPSPRHLQAVSEARPGSALIEVRDDHPALLEAAVPARWSYCRPEVPGACGTGLPWRDGPRDRCDDVQQRRICAINDGKLVPKDGCLVCVKD